MATRSATSGKEGEPALRLPEEAREERLKKYKAKRCEAYGRVQPESVGVPDAVLAKTPELSFAYVSALKPKKTNKVGA